MIGFDCLGLMPLSTSKVILCKSSFTDRGNHNAQCKVATFGIKHDHFDVLFLSFLMEFCFVFFYIFKNKQHGL